ncbi:hypothetical protein WN51_09634 [Melipona quadrifasciata]|uniref:Uncharacterized protein n=1 Tax=Melipona quadrifasciata TaxID=166423 RepID=A0A0N0BI88_9HYME|nr:hypothetical protein WN51_09634 [Melipona quadrifasciata]
MCGIFQNIKLKCSVSVTAARNCIGIRGLSIKFDLDTAEMGKIWNFERTV